MGNSLCERKQRSVPSNRQFSVNPKQLDILINCKMISTILHNRFLTMNWDEFKFTFMIDENYGAGFDWDHVQLNSYFDPWIEICSDLPNLNQKKAIRQFVEKLPVMDLSLLKTQQEKVKILSQLLFLTNSYLFNDFPNVPQTLPKNLSLPLYLLTNNLGTKPSMGWVQNLCNWRVLDQNQSHYDVNNLRLRFSFTDSDAEQIFYLISNIADFRMAIAIKSAFRANQLVVAFLQHNLYQMSAQYFLSYFMNGEQKNFTEFKHVINVKESEEISLQQIKPLTELLLTREDKIVDDVQGFLNEITKQMDDITSTLKEMFSRNDPNFFYGHLRNYVQGFMNKSVFPDGLYFEGIEQDVATEGGSGGNSPSFQIFERALGIWFDGDLESVQKVMRQGMLKRHLHLIKFMKQYSILRTYSLLTQNKAVKTAYNQAVESYINFNKKHLYYVEHYIVQQMKKKDPNIDTSQCRGTGDVLLLTVKERYKSLSQFLIPV